MKILNDLTPEHVQYWADYEPVPIVMKAPEGMTNCSDCVSVRTVSDGDMVIRTAWKPSDDDIMQLLAGGTIWLSTWGILPPHMIEVQPPI